MKQKLLYQSFFRIAFFIIVQNLIIYSVNVADNVMLGSYSQTALAGAATVNQIQFLLQQITLGLGEGLAAISSRYWGKQELRPIYSLSWLALAIGLSFGAFLTIAACFFPLQILRIFTPDPAIIAAGAEYLAVMRFTYLPFIITNLLLSSLRSMENVKIGFIISCISLSISICTNYILIFGHLGAPKMGITGAAIGTLAARLIELMIIAGYIHRVHPDLLIPRPNTLTRPLLSSYARTSSPIVLTQAIFGLSITLQTIILGHLSSNAIAANSAASTAFQYLKLISIGFSSATVVVIGKLIGSGKADQLKKVKSQLQLLYLAVGLFICLVLNLIKYPFINLYSLTPAAGTLAVQIITLLSIVAIGTSYQMPVSTGIIRGSGDTSFTLKLDIVCVWLIMYPLSILAAFVWELPVIAVIALLNSDQIVKCIPVFIKVNKFFKVSEI